VTLVLGDVEGSTKAWEAGAKAVAEDLAALDAVVDEVVGRHDGVRPVERGRGTVSSPPLPAPWTP
jgi:hypothetical protein